MRLTLSRFAARTTLVVALFAASVAPAGAQTASDCPNDGTIRFGVEPYEDAALLAPAYQPLADALGKALNCKVELNITTNYTAEIEAMRSGKLAFDFRTLPDDVQAMFKSDVAMPGTHLVPEDDSYFDEIRSLVSILNVDLSSL